MIFANSSREFECGESEQFEKRVLLNDLFLRIRDGLTEMIIRTAVNFFYHNILLLIKVHIQNISSEPGLTKNISCSVSSVVRPGSFSTDVSAE